MMCSATNVRYEATTAEGAQGAVTHGEVVVDGRDYLIPTGGQEWRVRWFPPAAEPVGTAHGAAAVCVADDRVVLVSDDGERWGIPGGRPEAGEDWAATLRREVLEEACAVVTACELLGFSRGVCTRGPQRGLALVRSIWRADVRLEPWRPRFEMTHRRLAPAAEALRLTIAAEPRMAPFYRRFFLEAGLPATADGG
jgi:ADP-ribose pyrophosphatase YjhB (NUDIX family)